MADTTWVKGDFVRAPSGRVGTISHMRQGRVNLTLYVRTASVHRDLSVTHGDVSVKATACTKATAEEMTAYEAALLAERARRDGVL